MVTADVSASPQHNEATAVTIPWTNITGLAADAHPRVLSERKLYFCARTPSIPAVPGVLEATKPLTLVLDVCASRQCVSFCLLSFSFFTRLFSLFTLHTLSNTVMLSHLYIIFFSNKQQQ